MRSGSGRPPPARPRARRLSGTLSRKTCFVGPLKTGMACAAAACAGAVYPMRGRPAPPPYRTPPLYGVSICTFDAAGLMQNDLVDVGSEGRNGDPGTNLRIAGFAARPALDDGVIGAVGKQGFQHGEIEAMAAAVRVIGGEKGITGQREVADGVEGLMAGEIIPAIQTPPPDSR